MYICWMIDTLRHFHAKVTRAKQLTQDFRAALTALLSKPALSRWPHVIIAISLVILMLWILGDTLNDLENNSWGLTTRFSNNRPIAAVFALKIFGTILLGIGAIKEELFFVRHIRSRLLNSLVLTTLVGVAGVFILVYADVFKTFGLIDTGNHRSEIHDWIISVYFSAVTWTTVGYGDFVPTEWARIFAATEALIGYVWMAALIAVFARAYSKLAE